METVDVKRGLSGCGDTTSRVDATAPLQLTNSIFTFKSLYHLSYMETALHELSIIAMDR
jgi:hypothetical protein